MKNFIAEFSLFVIFISTLIFIIGFLMIFSEEKRKLGLKMLLYSVIAFMIGFGACVASVELRNFI